MGHLELFEATATCAPLSMGLWELWKMINLHEYCALEGIIIAESSFAHTGICPVLDICTTWQSIKIAYWLQLWWGLSPLSVHTIVPLVPLDLYCFPFMRFLIFSCAVKYFCIVFFNFDTALQYGLNETPQFHASWKFEENVSVSVALFYVHFMCSSFFLGPNYSSFTSLAIVTSGHGSVCLFKHCSTIVCDPSRASLEDWNTRSKKWSEPRAVCPHNAKVKRTATRTWSEPNCSFPMGLFVWSVHIYAKKGWLITLSLFWGLKGTKCENNLRLFTWLLFWYCAISQRSY